MTPADTAKLLTLITGYDGRPFDELNVRAWTVTLTNTDPADAIEATHRHYRTNTRWAMPADIRTLANSIADDRANSQRARQPRALDTADPVGQQRARTLIDQLAETLANPGERSPHPPRQPAELQRRARTVTCPWCNAPTGQACTNQGTGRPATYTHDARFELAAQPAETRTA